MDEASYYPFGLTMAGISSKAIGKLENKRGYNGNELRNKEFGDGSGLELYDFNARTYDQQLGRFIQVDPLSNEDGQEAGSPYHFSYNNPVRFGDPDGKLPIVLPIIYAIGEGLVALGASAGLVMVVDRMVEIGSEMQLDLPAAPAGNMTFVPHITIPQSSLREMSAAKRNENIAVSGPIHDGRDLVKDLLSNNRAYAQKKGPKDLIQEAKEKATEASQRAAKRASY